MNPTSNAVSQNDDYKTFDGDSLPLDPSSDFFLDHVSRYWWAAEQLKGNTVLDCACGHGYGSYILASHAAQVLGVDLNPHSLKEASSHFKKQNLKFAEQNILKLKEMNQKFDAVTAFEVIEHIPPETTDLFLEGISTILKPNGVLLISTPNHDVVLKSGVHVPEFHINNFRAPELRSALKRHFKTVEILGQFSKRSGLRQLLFDFDFFNLRHLVSKFAKEKSSHHPKEVIQKPVINSKLFETPYAGCENYLFSKNHWRQAGLSVAICKND